MTLVRRALIAAVGVCILTALAGPVVSQAETCWKYREKEQKFRRQTNQDRAHHGLSKLSMDPELGKVARHQANLMADRMSIYHTKRFGRKVTNWWALGENVGFGGRVKRIENDFMRSPSHRSNILYPEFRNIGVGTKRAHGRLWVSVVFEAHANPGTTLNMPDC